MGLTLLRLHPPILAFAAIVGFRAGLGMIDYQKPPIPKLSPDDLAWLNARV
jgi:hypothetical protein